MENSVCIIFRDKEYDVQRRLGSFGIQKIQIVLFGLQRLRREAIFEVQNRGKTGSTGLNCESVGIKYPKLLA